MFHLLHYSPPQSWWGSIPATNTFEGIWICRFCNIVNFNLVQCCKKLGLISWMGRHEFLLWLDSISNGEAWLGRVFLRPPRSFLLVLLLRLRRLLLAECHGRLPSCCVAAFTFLKSDLSKYVKYMRRVFEDVVKKCGCSFISTSINVIQRSPFMTFLDHSFASQVPRPTWEVSRGTWLVSPTPRAPQLWFQNSKFLSLLLGVKTFELGFCF